MSMLCTNTEMEPVQLSLNTVVDVDYVDSIHEKKQILCVIYKQDKSTFATFSDMYIVVVYLTSSMPTRIYLP